jgi:choline dehydrogenase
MPQTVLGVSTIFLPRGKVLGGSSAIKGTVTVYPPREDIDHWSKLGNRG